MKKTAFSLVLLIGFAAFSCSDKKTDNSAAVTPQEKEEGRPTSLNIRYIDMDSIGQKYTLAVEFQEKQLRALSTLQSASQTKENEIQKFGQQIEEKARSNGYLSQDSYEADIAKINKMQQDAQYYLANLQRQTEQDLAQQQQQLTDSIDSFIKMYNAAKGYDAILYKAAGIYFNPSLDITNEVIEGLNARYKKADK